MPDFTPTSSSPNSIFPPPSVLAIANICLPTVFAKKPDAGIVPTVVPVGEALLTFSPA